MNAETIAPTRFETPLTDALFASRDISAPFLIPLHWKRFSTVSSIIEDPFDVEFTINWGI